MKFMKRIIVVLTLCVAITLMTPNVSFNQYLATTQAATIKLNKSTLTLRVGKSYQLKLRGTSKKTTWSSSKRKIATVDNGFVTAKKAGTTVIMAKVGKKTYPCVVTVKKASSSSQTNHQQITYKQAEKIALKKVGGGVMTDIDLDYEKGVLVYEIEVFYNGNDYDVVINAKTGKVITCHIDY